MKEVGSDLAIVPNQLQVLKQKENTEGKVIGN
jgi:hypothetical protein